MSLSRSCVKIIKCLLVNWTVVAGLGFVIFFVAVRMALFSPPQRLVYHNEDDDYQDSPQHHIPHHPRNLKFDDEDKDEPVIIHKTSPKPATTKAVRKSLVVDGKIVNNGTTTPFLIDGMDWRIAAWEYFIHFQGVNNSKLVLLWSPYYKDDTWQSHKFKNQGPVIRLGTPDKNGNYSDKRSCYLGVDKTRRDEAAAIVFHARSDELYLTEHIPDSRTPDQYWIYYDIDTPIQMGKDRVEIMNQLAVNWIWSYHHNADIPQPFGFFEKRTQPLKLNPIEISKRYEKFSERMFDAMVTSVVCE